MVTNESDDTVANTCDQNNTSPQHNANKLVVKLEMRGVNL